MRALILCLLLLSTLTQAQPLPGEWRDASGDSHTGRMEAVVLKSDEWGSTTVRVYQPEVYEQNPLARFPVLYVLDGQNVFQKGVYGDWEFDETVDGMIASGKIPPLLVVSIDHPAARSDGYTSRRIWMPGERKGPGHEEGGKADDYLELVREIQQTVEQRYPRTTGDNGLVGSSLGGVFALHAAFAPGSSFQRVAALSPSLWWYGEPGVGELFPTRPSGGPKRLWVDMGEEETKAPFNAVYVESAQLTAEWLAVCLGAQTEVHFASFEGANHNESAWSKRLPEVLEFLYSARSTPTDR